MYERSLPMVSCRKVANFPFTLSAHILAWFGAGDVDGGLSVFPTISLAINPMIGIGKLCPYKWNQYANMKT
jgi:hypothetical protein